MTWDNPLRSSPALVPSPRHQNLLRITVGTAGGFSSARTQPCEKLLAYLDSLKEEKEFPRLGIGARGGKGPGMNVLRRISAEDGWTRKGWKDVLPPRTGRLHHSRAPIWRKQTLRTCSMSLVLEARSLLSRGRGCFVLAPGTAQLKGRGLIAFGWTRR